MHTVQAAGTYYVWIKPQPDEVGTGYTLILESPGAPGPTPVLDRGSGP